VLDAAAARKEVAANAEQSRQALEEERARGTALTREIAAAQRENERQAALLKASEETARLNQAEGAKSAPLLEQEREKATALALEAAAARKELATSTEQSRQALEEERTRGTALALELATAQRENERQAALLKASEGTAQTKQATERVTAKPRQSPQIERDRTEAMARDLDSARRPASARVAPEPVASGPIAKPAQAVEVVAVAQPRVGVQGGPEAKRLVARASALLSQGDIGAARAVLERAVETGSAQARFRLAEKYDPGSLSALGTYGTRGEVRKARELYAKANAGGIQEAKDRLRALGP
jgi:hypothetical protein